MLKPSRTARKLSLFLCLLFLLTQTLFPLSGAEQMIEEEAAQAPVTIVREEEAFRGKFEKHYLCSDGTYLAVSYPEAVHYLDSDGETWLDADNRLMYQAASDTYRTAANEAIQVSLPADGSSALSGGMFSIGAPDGAAILAEPVVLPTELSLQLSAYAGQTAFPTPRTATRAIVNTAEAVSPIGKTIDDNDSFALPYVSDSILYKGLLGNGKADVQYIVSQDKIKENVILHEGSTIDTLTYTIPSGGLTAAVQEDGRVLLTNAAGEVKYTISAPFLYDAADVYCYAVEVSASVQTDGSTVITYEIDKDWLFDDARVYPIVFDPTVYAAAYATNIVDTYVVEGEPATDHSSENRLRVGLKDGTEYISFIMFNCLPRSGSDMNIITAEIDLTIWDGTTTGETFAAYVTYNSWSKNTISYDNQPPITKTPLDSITFSSSRTHYVFDVTSYAASLYQYGNTILSFAVTYQEVINPTGAAANINDRNSFKSSENDSDVPVIRINYSTTYQLRRFKNVGTGEYLTVYNGRCTNVNVCVSKDEQTTPTNYLGQGMRVVFMGAGQYRLVPLCRMNGTEGVIARASSSSYNVISSNLSSMSSTDSFRIIEVSSGQYKILYGSSGTLALTANSNNASNYYGTESTSTTSAGNVYLSSYNDLNTQKWIIESYDPFNEAYYRGSSNEIEFGHPLGSSYEWVDTPINSDYGYRKIDEKSTADPTFHRGLDFNYSTGTSLYSPFTGTVVAAGNHDVRGYYIVIKSTSYTDPNGNPLYVIYQHMNTPALVTSGTVYKTTKVGTVGNTGNGSVGPHLHMEVATNFTSINSSYTSIDPMIFYMNKGFYTTFS